MKVAIENTHVKDNVSITLFAPSLHGLVVEHPPMKQEVRFRFQVRAHALSPWILGSIPSVGHAINI